MNNKYLSQKILSGTVILIGLYMIVTYFGKATPPTLSGLAFILIGSSICLSTSKKK